MENHEQIDCYEALDVDQRRIARPGGPIVFLGAGLCLAPGALPGSLIGDISKSPCIVQDVLEWQGSPGIGSQVDFSEEPTPTSRFLPFCAVNEYIESLVATVEIPAGHLDSDAEPPTADCLEYSSQFLQQLFAAYGMIPYKVSISTCGAIYAAYRNPQSGSVLRTEIDNELDVVATVSRSGKIVASGFFRRDEAVLVNAFDPRLATTASLQGTNDDAMF